MVEGRRILVTGGAGFIGRHVVSSLAPTSRVVVLDDLSTGHAEGLPSVVELVEDDIASEGVVRRMVGLEPDVIVHAAAQASVTASERDPERDRAVNVEGTRHVSEAARRLGGRPILFLSSGGALYGDTSRRATERTRPRPMSAYGVHKWEAEQLLRASTMPFRVLRLANVYGPGQRSDLEAGVIAIFLERLRSGRPLTIYGSGEQIRDFIEVGDVVSAIELLIDWPHDGTWNVSTGRSTTIEELVGLAEAAVGVRAVVRHEPARPKDIAQSLISSARIQRETDWRPATALEAGLATLVRSKVGGRLSTAPTRGTPRST